MPLAVSEYNQPVPDIAVVAGSFRDYEADHPSTAALVVEVADTSLAFDRMTKAGLYARASVPEYWIINLSDRLLEVHREPAALSGEPGGYHYKSIERYDDSATIGPLIAPNAADRIADLLPTSA
jgi:Uma2 family endonuclease